MTYPDAKPVRQKLHLVNPRKAATIKEEVEKLLKAGFIYPVQLTEWVSNLVPVNKKQGMIHVCMDFHDLNKACPKDNFLPHLSIRLSMNVQAVKSFHSWMVFWDTIRFKSNPRTNIKQLLFVLGVPSRIVRCLLA
jgi:hypothetical protein